MLNGGGASGGHHAQHSHHHHSSSSNHLHLNHNHHMMNHHSSVPLPPPPSTSSNKLNSHVMNGSSNGASMTNGSAHHHLNGTNSSTMNGSSSNLLALTNGHANGSTNVSSSNSNNSSSSNSSHSNGSNGSSNSNNNNNNVNSSSVNVSTGSSNGSPTSTNNPNNSLILASSKALMLTNGNGLYKVFSTESVLNLLHCLYCKKPYRDPRLLNCGHTYCLPCLIQMNRYSTIRCIKCNSLHTVTSHAVDTLPKNLFVADIQCIPTVEIDRGAAYKETLKSLEDLKSKLLDFSDRLDQSEEKLINLAEMKKIEVSQHISKVIDQIRQLEEDFHNEIEEFKNNRLAVLRSAPAEFKETNANLLQFVNQSLDDMMRPDIKEEDVKEIYNRCEEHRRLWNETEIIFNSNYSVGEIQFVVNEQAVPKEVIGSIIQKLPQKLSAQRTAKGPISISECCVDGDYIVIENTSKRHDVNMTNWVLTHCVGSVRKISFKFPDQFVLKSRQSVKMWASGSKSANGSHSPTSGCSKLNGGRSSSPLSNLPSGSLLSKSPPNNNSSGTTSINGFYLNGSSSHHMSPSKETGSLLMSTTSNMGTMSTSDMMNYNGDGDVGASGIENELIIYDIENWICGAQEIFIRLENEFGEEKASFRKSN